MPKIKDVILFQIDQTSKKSKQYSQKIFDDLNINITIDQWVLLVIISEHEKLSQKELADQSNRDPASITRTLDLLEKKQLILRTNIPENRRKYHITLSNEGKQFVKAQMPLVNQMRQQSTANFTTKELELLSQMLKKIQANFT